MKLQNPEPASGQKSAAPSKKSYTGIMHRSYEVYDGPMDNQFEIDHILAAEYVGREDALRFVLEIFEERRLRTLEAQGELDPRKYPDIVAEIEAARVAAADALQSAESEFSVAATTHRDLRRQRGIALRNRDVMKLTRDERRLLEDAAIAREGKEDENGKIIQWGYETYLNNQKWAERQGKPLSDATLDRYGSEVERLKQQEIDLSEQAKEVGQTRADTIVAVEGYPTITLGELEQKLQEAKDVLEQKTVSRDAAKQRVHGVGRTGARITSGTMVAYFLAAYEKQLSTMDARALLAEYQEKIEKHAGLMPEWANWMAIDYAGLFYYRSNTAWHDPTSLLIALAEQYAAPLAQELDALPKKDKSPAMATRRAELEAELALIRNPKGPLVTSGEGKKGLRTAQLTPYLTYAQIHGISEQQRLGLLNHYWRRGLIPVDAWRYIVAKTQLRLNPAVIDDLLAADDLLNDQEKEGEPAEVRIAYYKQLIERTRASAEYVASISDPYWRGLLGEWRSKEFNAWRRRGKAEVEEKGAHRTTVVQKNAVCNETGETAQFRRGQNLPGGLWKNVKYYAEKHNFKRLTSPDLLIPGATLFNLQWMERLKAGETNGARYHKSIPYVTEGLRPIFPDGPDSASVIGDWQYYPRVGHESIARRIPDDGPRPLASGGRDPNEPFAEDVRAGDEQFLQWKHQATVTHSPWALGKRNVVLTWETRHGGAVEEHLGFRARNLSDIVGGWKFWVGWTDADEQAAAQTTAAHEAALSNAAAAGLPELQPGLLSGTQASSSALGEE